MFLVRNVGSLQSFPSFPLAPQIRLVQLALAYPVVAASPNVLGSDFGEVRGTAYLLVMRRFASGPEAEQRLERSHR